MDYPYFGENICSIRTILVIDSSNEGPKYMSFRRKKNLSRNNLQNPILPRTLIFAYYKPD